MGIDLDTTNAYTLSSSGFGRYAGSLGGWYRPDFAPSRSGTTAYFFDSDTARHAYYHGSTANELAMYNDQYKTVFDVTSAWTSGEWSHFLFVYNKTGDTQVLYIDGVAQSVNTAAGLWGSSSVGTNVHIAQRISGTQRLNGGVAEFFVTTDVLTQSHATQLALGVAPIMVVRNLVAYIPFHNSARVGNYVGVAPVKVGTPGDAPHPRIIYPYKRTIFVPAAAAASDPFFAHRIDRISKGQGPVDAAMLGGVMIE